MSRKPQKQAPVLPPLTTEINLATIARYFSDEEEAYKLIERIRWPQGPICPHCGVIDHAYHLKNQRAKSGRISPRRLWKCADCRKQFTVTVGTIFEDSHIPLYKWLLGAFLMCTGKNSVSAHELHRALGITYKAAWFMGHRLLHAMEQMPNQSLMTGIVSADETYIGGHLKNMPRQKRRKVYADSQFSNKTAVVTLVSKSGEARSQAVERIDGNNLGMALARNVDQSATIVTDERPAYKLVTPLFGGHETVDHSQDEYVTPTGHSTNNVESYFSQLKRSIDGTHHHVSQRHLPRYLAQFDHMYNTREDKDGARMVQTIRQTTGRRLTYREPTGKPKAF